MGGAQDKSQRIKLDGCSKQQFANAGFGALAVVGEEL
jgi:hypothetical protein